MEIKIFSLEQANDRIPDLKSLLKKFRIKEKQMREILSGKSRQTVNLFEKELTEILRSFEELGCVLRDPYAGLVDFPSVYNKEPIYLCWKEGEDRIQFYHGVEDGFKGRKELPV